MKQHLTEIDGRRLLVLGLPEQSKFIQLVEDGSSFLCGLKDGDIWHTQIIPQGNWQLYGSPFSLSEEQAKEFVKMGSYQNTFWNYIKNDNHKSNQMPTALESWQSFLESEKVFKENPFGEKPNHASGLIDNYPTGHPLMDKVIERAKLWQEAEQRVFRNAVLLMEENN